MRRFLPLLLAVLPLAFAPAPSPKGEDAKGEKRFTLDVNGKKWPEVFKWLSDTSGKPVVAPVWPVGTCTVVTLPGKRYTVAEAIDLLNEALLGDDRPVKYFLSNRERTLVLVAVAEIAFKGLSVRVEDLPRRSRTELAAVFLPLKTLDAVAAGVVAQKKLGRFGALAVDERGNALLVQDQVGNLVNLVKAIRELDEPKRPKRP